MRFENVSFSYGDKELIKSLDMSIPDNKITVIMGASGNGKSTLLRLISGLEKPKEGNIVRQNGSISFMFQEDTLLPWLTALENVKLVLVKDGADGVAEEWLGRLGLSDSVNKYPSELSGGMKRRVAFARALAVHSDILLLDEPFTGLDEELKKNLRQLIAEERSGKTTVIVTHDADDTSIADTVITVKNDFSYEIKEK